MSVPSHREATVAQTVGKPNDHDSKVPEHTVHHSLLHSPDRLQDPW